MTVPPPSLSIDDIQSFKLVGVQVEGAEVIRSWPAEEEVFLRSGNTDPDLQVRLQTQPASNFPALTAHFERVLTARFGEDLNGYVGPILAGRRPVRAVVRLKMFDVPSGARRVFVDQDAKLRADIEIVDAKTGAGLLRYEGPLRTRRMIGGLLTGVAVAFERSDIGSMMLTEYSADYRNWLVRN